MPLSFEEIRLRLAETKNYQVENPYPPGVIKYPLRLASVLMPLLLENDKLKLLFIRRTTNHFDPHSGQVAFPGGASDANDSDEIETAIREAKEEIGINPLDVKIIGQLKKFITISCYKVTPIVCSIPWPYQLKLEKNEVSRAFTIPLEWLANPKNQQIQFRKIQKARFSIPVTYFRPYDGEVLWGASARFTLALIEVLYGTQS